MSSFVATAVKGKLRQYTALPAANDALVVVLFQAIQADASLRQLGNLGVILSAGGGTANVEATATGYSRQVLTTPSVDTVDYVNDWVDIALPALAPWSAIGNTGTTAGSGAGNNFIVAAGWFYDPDTTTGTDNDLVFLMIDENMQPTPGTGLATNGAALQVQQTSARAV